MKVSYGLEVGYCGQEALHSIAGACAGERCATQREQRSDENTKLMSSALRHAHPLYIQTRTMHHLLKLSNPPFPDHVSDPKLYATSLTTCAELPPPTHDDDEFTCTPACMPATASSKTPSKPGGSSSSSRHTLCAILSRRGARWCRRPFFLALLAIYIAFGTDLD